MMINEPQGKVRPSPNAFLAEGGEMGALTRAHNWSATALGSPDTWPLSLRTVVSLVLRSRFPMFLWWGSEMVQFYNDAYRPSLGESGKHPAALGQRGADCWPEIWPEISPLLAQVRAGGEAIWREDQLIPIHRNGRLEDVYWTFSYSAVLDDNGAVGGVLVVCTETTQQVQALAQVQRSDQRFQNLVRDAPVGIIVLLGEQLRVGIVNEAYGRLIDRTPEQLLDRPLFDVIQEAEAAFRPILDGVRQSGEPLHLHSHPYFMYAQGEKIEGFLDLIYQPYREADGAITGVMVLCHDVTERQRAAAAVREKNEQLTRINTDLDNFVYAASHDLRQPITNIDGLLHELRLELPPASQCGAVQPILDLMQSSVNRFQRTIDYLSEVVALQKEFGQAAPRVALLPVIEDVQLDLQPLIDQTSAQVRVDVAGCPTVAFSIKHLRSALYNLLSNALKYRHPDRVPTVHLRCRVEGPFSVLEVEDNGLGLTQNQQQELFVMFRRFHHHVDGSGIGLYLVRRSVENVGGRIDVTSTPGGGSTFAVYLPR